MLNTEGHLYLMGLMAGTCSAGHTCGPVHFVAVIVHFVVFFKP